MKHLFEVKRKTKKQRWKYRRLATQLRFGRDCFRDVPMVFGNAMPKAGSHLLTQVLYGLTRIGPFVNPGYPPVNRFEDNSPLSEQVVAAEILGMQPGDIRYGYLPYRDPYIELLTRPGMAVIFISRDPRDLLVSHVFFALNIHKEHGHHRFYRQMETMEQRLNAAISGVDIPGLELPSVVERFRVYQGWFSQPGVLHVKFEDLINHRDQALGNILDYVSGFGFVPRMPRDQALQAMKSSIQPGKSGTFRKGKTGGWREHFTPANKALFKETTGDLLIRLGYEKDQDW